MTVHNNNGGGSVDNSALAASAVLACFCGGVDGSSMDDGAHQRWGESRTWCLGTIVGHPLPTCTTATMAAEWTNGGGAEDGAMAASLAVPCPLV
jgi:hypothetical protein